MRDCLLFRGLLLPESTVLGYQNANEQPNLTKQKKWFNSLEVQKEL